MSPSRYRGWSFLSPDIDAPEEFAGLGISPTGGIQMVEETASVRQSILLLLSTIPGERVMRPTFGCNLKSLVFAPNNSSTVALARHYVQDGLKQWEPRINVQNVNVTSDNTGGVLLIEVSYSIKATLQIESLIYPFFLEQQP